MDTQEFITNSTESTQEIGRKFGSSLKPGDIVALIGQLGAGKTTFSQSIAQALGVAQPLISPTFIIMRSYKLTHGGELYHVDLYRLERDVVNEIENIGLPSIWEGGEDIMLIEWAEKINDILPHRTKFVKIEVQEDDTRKITITNNLK